MPSDAQEWLAKLLESERSLYEEIARILTAVPTGPAEEGEI